VPVKKADRPACEPARNSPHLVQSVAADLDCSLGEADRIISAFGQAWAEAYKRGERIHFDGIGTLGSAIRKAHMKPCGQKIATRKWQNDIAEWVPDTRLPTMAISPLLFKLINEEYRGLDSIEEIYETRKSRPSKAHC
jgi:nucleoid DNA-binding protein